MVILAVLATPMVGGGSRSGNYGVENITEF